MPNETLYTPSSVRGRGRRSDLNPPSHVGETPTDKETFRERTMHESRTQQNEGTGPSAWATADSNVLTTPLPLELQDATHAIFTESSIETLAEWVERVRVHLDGNSVTVDDLCQTSEPTGHRAELGDDTYHFMCFYDAVVLAALAESAVDITTRSPGGTEIEARAIGTDSLTVTPGSVVTSFGVAMEASPDQGTVPSIDDVYRAVCPYVKAFPDYAAYRRWADEQAAPTVAMPLGDATAIARALVDTSD